MKFLTLSMLILFAGITLNAQTYTVNAEESNLHWLGQKVTGSHDGDVNIKEGKIKLKDGELSGEVVIDMTSMVCTDIEDAELAQKLVGHLMADDFFAVSDNPTATIKIKKSEKVYRSDATHIITGDLTIKGITKEVKIPAKVSVNSDGFTADAAFPINRTKWDVKYGSGGFFDGLGDKMIYDDIQFTLKLTASPKVKK